MGSKGQSATEFAEGRPFTGGTLTWAASTLRARGKGKRREGGTRAKRPRKIRMTEVDRRSTKTPVAEIHIHHVHR